jgi:DNA-binding NarL/FixJ family response regulator
MTTMKINPYRKFNDPCALTPYEKRILEMLNNGLSVREVAAELRLKSVNGLRAKLCVIREKTSYAEAR